MDWIHRNSRDRIIWVDKPMQVIFMNIPEDEGETKPNYYGGIAIYDNVICGCCGSTIPFADIYDGAQEIGVSVQDAIKPFEEWLDISDEIIGVDWNKEGA